MRSVCAILSAFLILFQSINFSYDDLSKLDELIEHAKFHKAEYGDSFITFLSKHYGELKEEHHQKHQEEHDDHEELPFQCHDYNTIPVVFVLQQRSTDADPLECISNQESNFFYLLPVSSLHKKGLLQPPKFS